MKKILTTGLCLALASIGGAEVIQTVNFNPARFGQYERLKVSEKATLQGGLSANSMQVQSAGTVTLTATPSAGQKPLAYDILKLDASRGFSSLGTASFPADPTLDFPDTCFSSLESCVTATATGDLNVKFQEGKARFLAPASYTAPSSRINQITTEANRLRLEAVYATFQGKLNVTGAGDHSFRNISSETPLRLAGNWIPLPSQGGGPTGGKLKWEKRKTVKYADHGGDTVTVLALAGGTPTSCKKTCPAERCPKGQDGFITYELDETKCECVEVSRNCRKPYTTTYRWSCSDIARPPTGVMDTCWFGIAGDTIPKNPCDIDHTTEGKNVCYYQKTTGQPDGNNLIPPEMGGPTNGNGTTITTPGGGGSSGTTPPWTAGQTQWIKCTCRAEKNYNP